MCTHTHTHTHTHLRKDCIWITVAIAFLVKHFLHKSGVVRSVRWMFHYWGAGLAVSVRICGIGHNVLKSFSQTWNTSSSSFLRIFFLIAFLEEAYDRNIIIIPCIILLYALMIINFWKGWEGVHCVYVDQIGPLQDSCKHCKEASCSIKCVECLTSWRIASSQ